MKQPEHSSTEQEVAARVRELLNQGVEELDPAIAGRLRAARRQALESADASRKARFAFPPLSRQWYLGGATAATVMLAVLIAAPWQDAVEDPSQGTGEIVAGAENEDQVSVAALDLEMMSEDETLELLEELEFYQWLLESEQDAG